MSSFRLQGRRTTFLIDVAGNAGADLPWTRALADDRRTRVPVVMYRVR